MSLPRCRSVLCLVPLVLLVTSLVISLQSQTATPSPPNAVPTIKTQVRRVLVDVVVTNDKGEAVTGLHQGDFEILEDGKPQPVATFEEHRGALPTQIQLPPLPPHVYTNFPAIQTADSVNVLLLDALNTPPRGQSDTHWQMIKYLRTIPPGTRVAIFILSSRLRMLQAVTTDPSELLAAINSPHAGTQPSGVLTSTEEAEELHHFIGFLEANEAGPTSAPPTLAQAEVDPINAIKEFLTEAATLQTKSRISITLQALQQLARYLGGVPGRKNLIWFSGSFPMAIFPSADLPDSMVGIADFSPEVRKTADLLSAGQVALYPVASEGLENDPVFEANGEEISGMRPSMATQDQVQQLQGGQMNRILNQGTMDELAKDTGGRAYYNTNGLSDALARAINNGARYYSLTYAPANPKMDGKYRHIQVKLLNGKHTLAYRRGYYADDLATTMTTGQKSDSDPLLPLMGRNLPDYSQILYKILAEPSKPQPAADAPRIGSAELKGPFIRYSVDFAISVEDLRLDAAPDGARHGNVEVSLVAYDREGKPLNLVVTPGEIVLKPKEYATVQQGGLQIHKEIDVPKEYVYLRTGVYDLRSSAAGTLGFPLNEATAARAK